MQVINISTPNFLYKGKNIRQQAFSNDKVINYWAILNKENT